MMGANYPRAFLDTNAIYPIVTRDVLLWFAHYDLFEPKWSKHIFDEWRTVMFRKGIEPFEAERRIDVINKAFPDAMVVEYESLISTIRLPDPSDCHVLAAALKSGSGVIVTNNLRHFPEEYLGTFGLIVLSPDDFLVQILTAHLQLSLEAFLDMVSYKLNPKITAMDVLKSLENVGLSQFAKRMRTLLNYN